MTPDPYLYTGLPHPASPSSGLPEVANPRTVTTVVERGPEGRLPVTGADVATTSGVATALVLAGLLALVVSRRRKDVRYMMQMTAIQQTRQARQALKAAQLQRIEAQEREWEELKVELERSRWHPSYGRPYDQDDESA